LKISARFSLAKAPLKSSLDGSSKSIMVGIKEKRNF
jgi:hypothetical protein